MKKGMNALEEANFWSKGLGYENFDDVPEFKRLWIVRVVSGEVNREQALCVLEKMVKSNA